MIDFKFFNFVSQNLLNSDWLLALETTDFNAWIFNENINWLFAKFIKIWFLFNHELLMIILCYFKQVINKDIISFLCFYIMIDVYRACIIDFRLKISLYN